MSKWKGFIVGVVTGCALMITVTAYGETMKEYVLKVVDYPILVNGETYVSDELPVLNYEGHTYIPMRSVGDILGASVDWNDEAKQAEITYGQEAENENTAFREVKVSGSDGSYTISGEARVFEASMSYAVSDGHRYVLESYHTLDAGAPAWSPFELNIELEPDQIPENGTLMIELFEYSAKDGSKIHELHVPLESFES